MSSLRYKETWAKSRTPNLVKYVPTGCYYGRAKVQGKPRYESLNSNNYDVACRRLTGFLARIAKLRTAARKSKLNVTLSDLVDEFESTIRKNNDLKPNSKAARLYATKRLRETWPEAMALAPAAIEFDDCKKWVDFLRENGTDFTLPGTETIREGNSSSTINKTILALAAVLDIAFRKGLVSENVARIKGLHVKDTAKKGNIPSKEDFSRIVLELSKAEGYAAYCSRFLASTGCRIEEAGLIKFKHADFEKNELLIPGTKTASSYRKIPISQSLKILLGSYRLEVEQVAKKGTDEIKVFPIKTLNKPIAAACRKLGIPKFTNHDLRDYFATTCLEAGVPVHTVAAWIGHSDGGITLLRRYAHLRDNHAREVAKGLEF